MEELSPFYRRLLHFLSVPSPDAKSAISTKKNSEKSFYQALHGFHYNLLVSGGSFFCLFFLFCHFIEALLRLLCCACIKAQKNCVLLVTTSIKFCSVLASSLQIFSFRNAQCLLYQFSSHILSFAVVSFFAGTKFLLLISGNFSLCMLQSFVCHKAWEEEVKKQKSSLLAFRVHVEF